MRSVVLTACALLCAGSAAAQIFPGDVPKPPAFPTAFSFAGTGAFGADLRAYRDYADTLCFPQLCHRQFAVTGGLGLAARFQVPVGRRTGLRAGVVVSGPKRKLQSANGNQFLVTDKLSLIRGEIFLMFRLKPQVPIYFGAGPTFARFSPGPVPGQSDITEMGVGGVIGIDHQISKTVATRFEWGLYGTKPKTTGLNSEYSPPSLALDTQISFGVNFYLQPVIRDK